MHLHIDSKTKRAVFTDYGPNTEQTFVFKKDGTIAVKGNEEWGVLGSDGTNIFMTKKKV